MAETADFEFEEGFPWPLPLHVLDQDQLKHSKHLSDGHHFGPQASAAEPDSFHPLNLKSTPRLQRTPRNHPAPAINNIGFGGPGMQAVFLDSGQRSCGTGVFLPRRNGTTHSHTSKKPACPPVLLPYRIVHALNLNVHEIGLQIKNKPCRDPMKQYKNVDENLHKNKRKNDASAQYCSPEIFLPKEWTY